MILSQAIVAQQQLVFLGNSLLNLAQNSSTVLNGHYVSTGVYNTVKTGRVLAFTCHAVSGMDQQEMNAILAGTVLPYLNAGDVVVVWEGTNDIAANGLTGQQAFDNLVLCLEALEPTGVEVVVCTVIARDFATDDASVMDTHIPAYNVLVRNNAATYGYTLCDLAADAMFDARADCANATNYTADKTHLATAGQNNVITLLSATLETVLP